MRKKHTGRDILGITTTSIRTMLDGGRRLTSIAVLMCALSALNCFNDPLVPVPPKWDTQLTIPLSNRSLTLLEIIARDSSLLKTGAGNQLVYGQTAVMPPSYVGAGVSVSLPSSSSSMMFGPFDVFQQPSDFPCQLPGLTPGSSTSIPPATFDAPDIPNSAAGSLDATFVSGRIRLTLVNNLPVVISVVTPIVIRNGATVNASFNFTDPIPAGGSAWAEDDLAGDRLESGDAVSGLRFSTPGTGGATVTIPATALVATLSTSGLKASTATLPALPALRMTDNRVTSLALGDSTRIGSALLRSGRVDLTFMSRLPIDIRLKFRIAELTRSTGTGPASVEDSLIIPAGGSSVYPLDLSGKLLQAVSPAQLLDSIKLISSVIVPVGVNHAVTMHDSDKIMITMRTAVPIIADSASVVLKPTWIAMNSVIPFDAGSLPVKFTGALNLPAASLSLSLASSIGFPMDLHIRLLARKANGDSAVLLLPANQQRVVPGTNIVRFDNAEVGQFLSQLAGKLPDSIRVTGSVLVNPPDVYNPTPSGSGRIGRNCALSGTMNLQVPLHLGITGGSFQDTLAWGDTDGDGSTESSPDRGSFAEMNSGTIYAEIQNSLPLEVGVQVQLLDGARRSLLVIPQDGTDIQVTSAAVDAGGNVTVPANSAVVVQLSSADIRQFGATEFIRYGLKLNTIGGGSPVSLKTSNGIHIRVWTQLSYRVNQ